MSDTTEIRPVEIGDFFRESWGYDQTNVDFYQVVKISKSGQTVWLRHVRSALVSSNGPADHVAPLPDEFDRDEHDYRDLGGTFRRKLTSSPYSGWWVNLTSYSGAGLWDCTPAHQTALGWGH